MNSKNNILGVMAILYAICFLGCAKNNVIINKSSIEQDYNLIGQEHNKGLDFIFQDLKESLSKAKTKSTDDGSKFYTDIFDLLENSSVNFVKASNYGKVSETEGLYKITKILYSSTSLKSKSDHLSNELDSDSINYLTSKQKYYLERYREIILSMRHDIDAVINNLNLLEEEIISNCDSSELKPLLCATSVGKYSLQYWHENLYKWMALFSNNKISLPKLKSSTEVETNDAEWEWFNNALISMGQSDGIGAALGAGLGALAGGVGAIPGAIVGGCNASAGAGIKELFKKWGIF